MGFKNSQLREFLSHYAYILIYSDFFSQNKIKKNHFDLFKIILLAKRYDIGYNKTNGRIKTMN